MSEETRVDIDRAPRRSSASIYISAIAAWFLNIAILQAMPADAYKDGLA